ncbi:hypothetical protein D9M68_803980 [compost metagenome]
MAAGKKSLPRAMSCGITMRKMAPRKAPWIEPSPPITTMSSKSIDWMMLNCSGERNWILCAYSAPPMPASAAESAKLMVL